MVAFDEGDFVGDVEAFRNVPEYGVFIIQKVIVDGVDEELAPIGIGAGVGHGEGATVVFEIGVEDIIDLITGAFVAVAARSVGAFEVAALDHEVGDDAMEYGAVVFFLFGEFDEVGGDFTRFISVDFGLDDTEGSFDDGDRVWLCFGH